MQVSRNAPPPLPGGYKVGEKVSFKGTNDTSSTGGEVCGEVSMVPSLSTSIGSPHT